MSRWLRAVALVVVLGGGGHAAQAQPIGEAPQLPQWREGPPTKLPPMQLPPRPAPARDLRWLYALGGVLVAAGVILYNRKVKATIAAADAEDADRKRLAETAIAGPAEDVPVVAPLPAPRSEEPPP